MWESKVWFVLERLVSLITIAVLAFAVWNTLLQIEAGSKKISDDVKMLQQLIQQEMEDQRNGRN